MALKSIEASTEGINETAGMAVAVKPTGETTKKFYYLLL